MALIICLQRDGKGLVALKFQHVASTFTSEYLIISKGSASLELVDFKYINIQVLQAVAVSGCSLL